MDTRYVYHWTILKEALERTKPLYGDYVMEASPTMSEPRQLIELTKGSENLTIMIRETSVEHENRLLSIRIPIDKDLIGYRVMLIHKDDQDKFSKFRTIKDLSHLTMGQGTGWGDVSILKSNGLKVKTRMDYEFLFKMVTNKNIDAFPRGVSEVIDEFESRRSAQPNMRIEKSILLHYPLPTYFWFSKNTQGEALRTRVETGMRSMITDGSFDKIFQKFHAHIINYHRLTSRHIIHLNNPNLPPETPFNDTALWFDLYNYTGLKD